MFPNDTLPTLVTHTAASAGVSAPDVTNRFYRGVQIAVNITAITGTSPSMVVHIDAYDAASATYYTLLSSASLTATGFTLLTVYPGITATANVSASQVVPKTFRVRTVISGTGPAVTCTIGGNLVI